MPEGGGVLAVQAIQPHGVPLVLREPAWLAKKAWTRSPRCLSPCPPQVIAASANAGELPGISTEELLNRPLMGALSEGTALWPAFYVRDNGIGVAPEHHQEMFNLSRRLHDRDANDGGRHGGRIGLHSAPGTGTAIFLTPQANSAATAEESGAAGAE